MQPPRDGTPEADILVRPDRQGSGIESEMLRWLEDRAESLHSREGRDLKFELGGYGDPQWESYIESQGYVLGDTSIVHFWQPLDDVPATSPPPGFRVQGSAGESDAFARDAVLGRSFDRSGSRHEIYLNAMRTPGYRKDLDLAVVSDAGEQVAMCIVWFDSDNKAGLFEPVGCDPDYRRRGLSRALILEGLRRLKALGAESAVVYPWGSNEPAIRLYESCGFRELFRDRTFTKALQGS
jgi:ribosomal protein S18 acetylase RimI-like enzyme